jgi:hypothetical protein
VAVVHLLCLGLVVLGARVEFLRNSIRLDEAQSLWQTNHSYGALLQIIAEDVHVPLYHVLLRTWRLVLGPDVQTARLLSLVFLLAAVPVFYLVARKVLSTPWALFALVVFSCSPFLQWYGSEARMYSMLVFVTLVGQYFFLVLIRTDRIAPWVGYAATAVVGVYVHYFFVFVLVAQGTVPAGDVVTPAPSGRRAHGRGRRARVARVPAVVPVLPRQRLRVGHPAQPPGALVDRLLERLLAVPVRLPERRDQLDGAVGLPAPGARCTGQRPAGNRLDRATAYLVAAAFLPVLMAFVVSHAVAPFFLSRYMVPALPALLILLVRFISCLTKPVARGLAAVLLAVTVLGTVVQAANPDTPVEEDFRTAARLVEEGAGPQDLVVLSSPFTVYPFEYYYDGSARITTLPVWDRQGPIPAFAPAELPEDVESLAQGHQYLYLLLSYDQGYEEEVYQYFERNFEQTGAHTPSPGLRLLVYRVGYSELPPAGELEGFGD